MPAPNLLNPWGSPFVDERFRQVTTPVLEDIRQNPQNVAKGVLSAPFTTAPDLLGLIPGVNISGDPIREFIGLDPSSAAGILGEFMDPTSTALKGAKWLGKGLLALPLVPPAVLLKRGFDSEPLFHGTNRAFDRFERSQRGSSTGARSAKRGVWLTDDPDLAGAYADLSRSEELGKGWDKVMELERQGQYDAAAKLTRELEEADKIEAAGQNIRPSRVRGKFMEADMEGANYSASGTADRINDIISEAESKGFDGVRFKNLSDDPRPFTNKPSTHVLVFDEKNIASEFDFIDDVGGESLQRAELPKPADPGSVEETKLTKKQVDEFRQRVRDYNKPTVYHGTRDASLTIDALDPKKAIETPGTVFFSDNPSIADQFTYEREYGELITSDVDEFGDIIDLEPGPVLEAKLDISKPLELKGDDAQKFIDDTAYQTKIIEKAKRDGFDSVIAHDVTEFADDLERGNVYAVFDKSKIKGKR